MSRIRPADYVIDRSHDGVRWRPIVVALLVAFAIAIVLIDCAHAPDTGQLDVARARCDRDGGQWVVEYANDGTQTRCACIYYRR